jgi:hypothetical protein
MGKKREENKNSDRGLYRNAIKCMTKDYKIYFDYGYDWFSTWNNLRQEFDETVVATTQKDR